MTINKAAIFAGAVGGMVPNLLRLAINLTSDPPKPISHDPLGYVIGILLLGCLGALVAWIWQEIDMKKALYLGVGLPSLIQMAGLQSHQATTQSASTAMQASAFLFISSAYAQPVPEGEVTKVSGRKIAFVGDNTTPKYSVAFFQKDGQVFSTRLITKPGFEVVDVPSTATSFAIQAGSSKSETFPLPQKPGALKQASIQIIPQKSGGIVQALGFGESNEFDIKVVLQDVEHLPVAR
jgi:hypothetical protein